jgi:hypothetical protein
MQLAGSTPSVDKILSRLPPDNTVREAKELFSQQVTAELKRNRFGDPQKLKQAKKTNRLPAGTLYTVSAVAEAVEEPIAGRYRYPFPTVSNIDMRKILFLYKPVPK